MFFLFIWVWRLKALQEKTHAISSTKMGCIDSHIYRAFYVFTCSQNLSQNCKHALQRSMFFYMTYSWTISNHIEKLHEVSSAKRFNFSQDLNINKIKKQHRMWEKTCVYGKLAIIHFQLQFCHVYNINYKDCFANALCLLYLIL